jgi:hypothetical protein
MKIVIVSTNQVFEVQVLDDQDRTIRKFTYLSVQQARRAAAAWSTAYGNCPVIDQTEQKQ